MAQAQLWREAPRIINENEEDTCCESLRYSLGKANWMGEVVGKSRTQLVPMSPKGGLRVCKNQSGEAI